MLFGLSSEQSVYQNFLPKNLPTTEFLQDVLTDKTIPHVLNRLATGTPMEITPIGIYRLLSNLQDASK